MHPKLNDFLTTGEIPATSKERNLLLDLARLELSQTNKNTNMTIFRQNPITGKRETITDAQLKAETKAAEKYLEIKAQKEHVKQAQQKIVAASNPPVIHRAAVPVAAAKPLAPSDPKLTTAATFATPQLTMLRSEWSKLSIQDRARFFKENGKLVDDPKPAKTPSKNNQLNPGVIR